MGTNRRSFLYQTAFGVLTLGISQTELIRTTHSLAAVTPRKLALLVGINDYGEGNSHLQCCLTDVERQQELLVYLKWSNSSPVKNNLAKKERFNGRRGLKQCGSGSAHSPS